MVTNLLGPSLADLFDYCDGRFSLKTVLLLADQLICRMKYIHSKSVVHRDTKPQNLLMGSGRQGNVVFVIDFGVSEYVNPARSPSPDEDRVDHWPQFWGRPRPYASLNTHHGFRKYFTSSTAFISSASTKPKAEHSWRDDMESLGYILIQFALGSLPWQELEDTTDDDLTKIGQMKESMSGEELCKGLPSEFAWYIDYTRSLRFDEKPDYARLRRLFQRLFVRMGFRYDQVFDWTQKIFDEQQESRPEARVTRSISRLNGGL